MIPSENYLWWHPQKILLLRDFLSFGNCDGILKTQFPLVFFKWTPPKKNYVILRKCCHVVHFPWSSFIIYIYPKHPGNCLMYIQDILTAARTFCWYMWISWENSDDILTQSDGIFFLRPVIWLTEFRQKIISPGKRKSRMLHTKKGPREIYQIFLLVPCIHGKYWQIDVPYMVGFPNRSLWCNIFAQAS